MTAFDGFDKLDRRIADALEEIAMPRLPEYLDDIFRQTARSTQRPALLAHRRYRPMNRLSILAAAAAIVVAVVGGALVLNRSTLPPVGASPSPSPSPVPSSTPALASISDRIWGDWVADVQLGLPNQGPRIQLSISWGDGITVWLLTGYVNGAQVFMSDSLAAPEGQIRLRAQTTADGCTAGDVGTYGWSRSTDGTFLTLTLVADDCTARATALARTWVHTLSAVTDGGHGVLPVDGLELTLPNRKFGLTDLADGSYDRTWDSTPFIGLLAIRDPNRFLDPCSASNQKRTVGTSVAANVVAYVKGLPGFTWKTASATIDGHPAVHLTGTPRAGFTCAAGDIGIVPTMVGTEPDFTIAPGTPLSVWVTETGGHAWLFNYQGDQIKAADEATVIASLHFITQLPTP